MPFIIILSFFYVVSPCLTGRAEFTVRPGDAPQVDAQQTVSNPKGMKITVIIESA